MIEVHPPQQEKIYFHKKTQHKCQSGSKLDDDASEGSKICMTNSIVCQLKVLHYKNCDIYRENKTMRQKLMA